MEEHNKEPLVNALHPSVIDRLDPQFIEIYNKYQAPHLRADQVDYPEYNANRSKYSFPITPGPNPAVGSITLHQISVTNPPGEITLQIFTPTEASRQRTGLQTRDGRLPTHVNYHGGGFVIGNLASDESWCRQVCEAIGCNVVNVDYRLAPEYPHPTPVLDSWEALKWVFANSYDLRVDETRVSVGGLSAGGNIAAVCALLARDEPGMQKLVLQILVVPCTDVRFVPLEGSCDEETTPYESLVRNEFAPCLPLNRLRWFYRLWLGTDIEKRKDLADHFLASPILAESHANLAPASFHVAGVDTLTSEGIAYHEKLSKAGTQSKLKLYEGCGHPFGMWDGELEKGKEYVRDTIDALREVFRL